MVKHNNQLPNVHFHKWWQRYVRTWFNQPTKKRARRVTRQKKAAQQGIKPVGRLQPVVRPPTTQHNIKLRFGRGFTIDELKEVGLIPAAARSIGIAVDRRRKNRCVESLNENVSRLKSYLLKIVVFPRVKKAPKNGRAGIPDDTPRGSPTGDLLQHNIKKAFPVPRIDKKAFEVRAISKGERTSLAYSTLLRARIADRKKEPKK